MGQLENVKFDLIRYANCWEDADILVDALKINAQSRVLSIASAGDNSFSLLTGDPELVVAVDVSKVQLHLVELKKAAITELDYNSYLAFCGFLPSNNRLSTYSTIRKQLSEEAKIYWNANKIAIEAGIIFNGKFEKYFRIFSKKILPFCHSRKEVEELVRKKSTEEQQKFYNKTWNNWRWKFLTRIFFGKLIMGKLGRDPAFLKEVNISVGDYIYRETGAHLSSQLAQENCYDDFILFGQFNSNLPHYIRESNFQKIKKNIDRLVIYEGLAEDASTKYGTFTHFNLSNIFEYMDAEQFKNVATQIIKTAKPGATFGYWNLMVNRRISEQFPSKVEYLQQQSENLTAVDKCFFYKKFIIDRLNT